MKKFYNEEIQKNKTSMGIDPFLITEQASSPTLVYHEWQTCPGSFDGITDNPNSMPGISTLFMSPAVIYLSEANHLAGSPSDYGWTIGGTPPYVGTGNVPNQSSTWKQWATYKNSEVLWQFLGSPNPGQVVGYEIYSASTSWTATSVTGRACLEYLGPVASSTNHMFIMQNGSFLGPTNPSAFSARTGPYGTCSNCLVNVAGVTPSWDCDNNTGTCNDPGTGLGQYTSYNSCDSACVSNPTPSWDCDGAGTCSDPGTGQGQYMSLSLCSANCLAPIPAYRCHDCYTPCTQNVIDAGHCPYPTSFHCLNACADTTKWRCGFPDKWGNPRCRKCKQFELALLGTNCFNTEQECLDSDCDRKIYTPKDKIGTANLSPKYGSPSSSNEVPEEDLMKEELKNYYKYLY